MRRGARAALVCAALVASLAGCRDQRRDAPDRVLAAPAVEPVRQGTLRPGRDPEAPPASPAAARGYDTSSQAIADGKRWYDWYNCVGCHFRGGGGIGPPLMDDEWIYGSAPENIHRSIVEGRPNGMPSYGERIPDAQLWQIVAYVRSLSDLDGGRVEQSSRSESGAEEDEEHDPAAAPDPRDAGDERDPGAAR